MASSAQETFERFLDPDADSLLNKVDFLGLIGTFGKSGLLAVILSIIAVPLAVFGAIFEVIQAGTLSLQALSTALRSGMAEVQGGAVAVAAGELPAFDLAALPVSAAAALGPVLVVAIVIALAWGFD